MSERDALADVILRMAVYEGREGTVTTAEDRDSYTYLHCQNAADAILAAGYRKLEPIWAETLENDGVHEYTTSSDCDGSNVRRWRRKPKLAAVEDPQPWVQTP